MDISRIIASKPNSTGNFERSSGAIVKHIGIVLYDGFSLLGVGSLVDALNIANELQASVDGRCLTYRVSFLSDTGGIVTCSSSISVCTDRLDGQGFRTSDALYVASGIGVTRTAAVKELIELLKIASAQGTAACALGSGHALLTAADLSCDTCAWLGRDMSRHDSLIHARDEHSDVLVHAHVLLKLDLGDDMASSVIKRL